MELNVSDNPPDPFFDALRARHPDVDLVVLPPEPAEGRHVAPAPDEAVAAAGADVAAAAATLWRLALGEEGSQAQGPEVALRYGDRESEVCAVARVVHRGDDAPPAVEVWQRLTSALEDGGWEVRALPGDLERVAATRADLEVSASFAERTGVVQLVVSSLPLSVGVERARDLVRAGVR